MNCHSPRTELDFRWCLTLLLLGTLVFNGCGDSNRQVDESPAAPALQPLSVAFVEFPDIDGEVARQWSARRDGELTVKNVSVEELLADNYAAISDQDLLIYPSTLLGHLFADDKLTQVPGEVWNTEELNSRGLLRHSRTTLSRFNRQRWATPLGSSQFFLFLRSDVLAAVNASPPQQWSDLLDLVSMLHAREDLRDANGDLLPTKISIPTGPDWAARMHLAIAASRVRQRGRLDSLFERRTMKPLIDGPPFVRALEELKQLSSSDPVANPTDSVAAFLSGKVAVAIGWPSKATNAADVTSEAYAKTVVQRLPGSSAWFDFSTDQWQTRFSDQVVRVDLVGFNSFQVSILRSTSHPTSAYKFMSWISSKQMGSALFARSPHGAPARSSHLGNLTAWCGDKLEQETIDTMADLYREVNEDPVYLMFPRLHGSHDYWKILDDEIQVFLRNECTANEALSKVATRWDELTEKHGRDKQIEFLRLNQSL